MHRSILSLALLTAFLGLSATGIGLFFFAGNSKLILAHIGLALGFISIASMHITRHLKSLGSYLKRQAKHYWIALGMFILLGLLADHFWSEKLRSLYAGFQQGTTVQSDEVSVYQFDDNPNLSVELRAGRHFWFPQIAIWMADTTGNYLKTLFVTNSTASGEFYGGRSKETFRTFDAETTASEDYRRVDALPFWSKQRGIMQTDGLYAPTRLNPLPDGLSGATPSNNLLLETSHTYQDPYRLYVELNVAFDDNRFYSAYDFPEDSLYHSGTVLVEFFGIFATISYGMDFV